MSCGCMQLTLVLDPASVYGYRLSPIWLVWRAAEQQPLLHVLQLQLQLELVMPIMAPAMPEPHVLNQVCLADMWALCTATVLALTT